mmetsp:Transcript_54191/g.61590  ORF Transcript_54191/g.61590 Transcript_54191/m.61590 type:complete len:376 (+) Transcript_54191:56-1183(+)
MEILWIPRLINSTFCRGETLRKLNRIQVLRTSNKILDRSYSRRRRRGDISSKVSQRGMMTATTTTTKEYAFDPPPTVSLPVVNSKLFFPVRRVYCVGKNYVEHVKEMGGNIDAQRSKPVFFTKPTIDGVVFAGHNTDLYCSSNSKTICSSSNDNSDSNNNNSTPIKYPPNTENLHYEVELVVAIGKEIRYNKLSSVDEDDDVNDKNINDDAGDISRNAAILDCVYGYAVGIDLTRRDLQKEAKNSRGPWELGKYFDQSAPIGPITSIASFDTTKNNSINSPSSSSSSSSSSFEERLNGKTMSLMVNGIMKQSVQLQEMIWNVPEIITELSKSYSMKPGDLIMTGTPEGVGRVKVGDRLVGSIDGGLVEIVDITLV